MKKLFVLAAGLFLAGGCAHHEPRGGALSPGEEASEATTKGSGARALSGGSPTSELLQQDARFLRDANRSGRAEVELGQLAARNGQSSAIRNFGQRLVDDHTRADSALAQVAATKGTELPAGVNTSDRQMITDLSTLQGPDFDRAWLKDVIRAHEQAIHDYQLAARSSDADVRTFAQQQLPMLQEHLRTARSLATEMGTGGTQ